MTIRPEDKKIIYLQYMKWVSQTSYDLEDKSEVSAEELVYTVLAIVEKYYD